MKENTILATKSTLLHYDSACQLTTSRHINIIGILRSASRISNTRPCLFIPAFIAQIPLSAVSKPLRSPVHAKYYIDPASRNRSHHPALQVLYSSRLLHLPLSHHSTTTWPQTPKLKVGPLSQVTRHKALDLVAAPSNRGHKPSRWTRGVVTPEILLFPSPRRAYPPPHSELPDRIQRACFAAPCAYIFRHIQAVFQTPT